MEIVSGNRGSLPHGLCTDLSVYRHDVFVDMLGRGLDTPQGYEQDQFDRADTVITTATMDELASSA